MDSLFATSESASSEDEDNKSSTSDWGEAETSASSVSDDSGQNQAPSKEATETKATSTASEGDQAPSEESAPTNAASNGDPEQIQASPDAAPEMKATSNSTSEAVSSAKEETPSNDAVASVVPAANSTSLPSVPFPSSMSGPALSMWERGLEAWRAAKRAWDLKGWAETHASLLETEGQQHAVEEEAKGLIQSASWNPQTQYKLDKLRSGMEKYASRAGKLREKRQKYASQILQSSATGGGESSRLHTFCNQHVKWLEERHRWALTGGRPTEERLETIEHIRTQRDAARRAVELADPSSSLVTDNTGP